MHYEEKQGFPEGSISMSDRSVRTPHTVNNETKFQNKGENMKRNRLISKTLAAGAMLSSLTGRDAHAQKRLPPDPKNIRVGWVGTGPFTFYGHYMRVLNMSEEYNLLNMRVTHIWGDDYSKNYRGRPEWVKDMVDRWNSGSQAPANLVKLYNIPNLCKDYHEMVDEVDAAMIMDFDRSHELAEPFLKQGKPIFLCSPVAVNVPACEHILNLAKENNAAVFSGSFTMAYPPNVSRNNRVRHENIASFFASTGHAFFTSYANDGLEPVYWLVGSGVRKVQLVGWDGSKGYDPPGIPVSRIHLEYEPRGNNPPIQGVLTLGGYKNETEWYKVYYRDHTLLEGVTNSSGPVFNFRDFLINIQETFATNTSPETPEDILNKLKVIIAAYKSANEGNRPVSIDEVGDYRLPTIRIEKWDEIPK